MPICQLIHQEIQKISGLHVDLENLDLREYDNLIELLQKQTKSLKVYSKFLDCLNKESKKIIRRLCTDFGLNQIEMLFSNVSLEHDISDFIAVSVDQITEKTAIFTGNLSFSDYQKIHPGSTNLPQDLRIVLGTLDTEDSDIENINLTYVGDSMHCSNSMNLKSIKIAGVNGTIFSKYCNQLLAVEFGNCGSIELSECPNLVTASLQIVSGDLELKQCESLRNLSMFSSRGKLDLRGCKKLTLDNISSSFPNHKIYFDRLLILNSGLSAETDDALLSKFTINTEQIIRS